MVDQYRNNKGFLKCFLAGMVVVTLICLVNVSVTVAQWPTYTYNPGYGYLAGSSYAGYGSPYAYGGYSGYGFPGSSYSGYSGYDLPRWIIDLGASSDLYTARIGYELSIPYFQSAVRSGWTPWRSSSYYPGYTAPGGYTPFTSMPYYSSPGRPFSSYYPQFIPTSSPYSRSSPYPATYDSSSKLNTIVTVTGRVVGSYSINSNGREIKCYVHLPYQAVFQPLDLSEYMGEVVELSGYLSNQKLYGASFERVI
jgi:hypothetical protein